MLSRKKRIVHHIWQISCLLTVELDHITCWPNQINLTTCWPLTPTSLTSSDPVLLLASPQRNCHITHQSDIAKVTFIYSGGQITRDQHWVALAERWGGQIIGITNWFVTICRPPSTESAFIIWTGWTLAMVLRHDDSTINIIVVIIIII